MAYRSSSTTTGTNTSGSVAVPAGAAVNDIAILVLSLDNGNPPRTVTWPAGFTELDYGPNTGPDGQGTAIAWKRLTGADSGTYDVSWSVVSAEYIIQAALFSGRNTSSPPTHTEAIDNNSNASPISVNATAITASSGDDLCWIGSLDGNTVDIGTGCTAPTDFTERQDAVGADWCNLSLATRDNVTSGSTGTVTGTYTLSSGGAGWVAYLIRIPAIPIPSIWCLHL